jgi:ABC-type dipeptide/oligopeptide/nickel transport system permease component
MTRADRTVESPPIVEQRLHYRWPISVRFLLGRLFGALISVWGALTIVFIALNLSGDPVASMVSPQASLEDIERVRVMLGYDQPLYVQYLTFLKNVVTGNFPLSLRYAASPTELVFQRFPVTFILALSGMAVGVVLGLTIGYVAANGRRELVRELPMTLMVGLQALPPILLGVVLVLVFAVNLKWLPSSGSGTWAHLVLPSLTLGIYVAPSIARIFRTSILEVQGADHVRTALAKGLPERVVRLRHVAANAMIPVTNQIGLQLGAMLGGAVVVETIFAWPGVGQLAVNALTNQDYPVVLATVSFVAIVFVGVNLLVDVVSAILDPRLRVD